MIQRLFPSSLAFFNSETNYFRFSTSTERLRAAKIGKKMGWQQEDDPSWTYFHTETPGRENMHLCRLASCSLSAGSQNCTKISPRENPSRAEVSKINSFLIEHGIPVVSHVLSFHLPGESEPLVHHTTLENTFHPCLDHFTGMGLLTDRSSSSSVFLCVCDSISAEQAKKRLLDYV